MSQGSRRLSNLLSIGLVLVCVHQARASSLLIIGQADGPARRLDYNRQGNATAADVWTYSDSAAGTGLGAFNDPFVFQHSQAGRASFGNLGATRQSSISGAYLSNPVSTGFVLVSFVDHVTFSAGFGTPEYLEVDISVDGSVSANNINSSSALSDTRFGNAQHYFLGECSSTNCNAKVGLNPANTGSPVFQTSGFSSRQTWRIPLSMMFIGPVTDAFSLSSNLEVLVQLFQRGDLPPSSAGSVDYLSSSKPGSFRLQDANFAPLAATFTSESGYDYTQPIAASAVPEPGTFVLLSLGFFALLRRRSGGAMRPNTRLMQGHHGCS